MSWELLSYKYNYPSFSSSKDNYIDCVFPAKALTKFSFYVVSFALLQCIVMLIVIM